MLIVCVQKCKCKFGDLFISGPARIREHHIRDGVTWKETKEHIDWYFRAGSGKAQKVKNQLLMYKKKAWPFAVEQIFECASEYCGGISPGK